LNGADEVFSSTDPIRASAPMPTPKVRKKTPVVSSPELLVAADAQRQGRLDDAETLYRVVLKREPKHWQALHQLGAIHLARGQLPEALQYIGAAMKSNSSSAEVTSNYGVVLRRLKRDDEAIEYFNRALMLKPGYVPALLTRGASLQRLGRREEALANFDRVIEIEPTHAKAHYNRANILHELRRFDEALAAFSTAAALAPNDADIHWNESLTRLLCGDFSEGWKKYEWRLKRPAHKERNFTQPLWLGEESLSGKTILVHAEQGFGDTLQFVRYIPLLASKGARVVLEVQPALKTLITSLEGVSFLVARGEELPTFDLHCPILSLPLAFKTELASIPANVPYLHTPEDRQQKWRAELPKKNGLRVAFAWSGSATHEQDTVRSIPLAKWEPLFKIPGIEWISIQRDLRPGDREILSANGILHFGNDLADFSDTAAIVSESDLTLSVDTSVAHLAGALNQPAWILLQHSPDFRWLLDRSDSPWYPRAKLFRQPAFGDWGSVIAAAGKELGSLQQAPRS
jgi:tetratricopeptide (TPR) repeat protein